MKESPGEIVDEASSWLVGGGIVTMALFPLALPGIALVLVAAIPLLALAVPALVVGGIAVGAFRLVRALGHVMTGLRRRERPAGEVMRVTPASEGALTRPRVAAHR